MNQRICTVHIKEVFQVIDFVTCGSLKDSLSILTSLITIQESDYHNIVLQCMRFEIVQKVILGNLNDSS